MLAAAVSKDDKIQVHADRHHFFNFVKVGLIFRNMHRTAEQNQLLDIEARLARQHGDAAPMAVRDQVEALGMVAIHPGEKILSGNRSGTVAIAAAPFKAV